MNDHELSVRDQGKLASSFVGGLIDRFGLQADIHASESDDGIEVAVTGQGLGVLIGPKGQTLLAIQELTRTVVQRHTTGRSARITVDVAGYRQKRREALERFARDVAEDVRTSGVQKVLEPMPAADRKIVHDTVAEMEAVRTTSEGEEPHRRVVISPASPGTT